jgi:hypothetical protein
MGSEGRREQPADRPGQRPVYADPPEAERESRKARFLALGGEVSSILERAGYARCDGGFMAGNPEWCLPLSAWKARFSGWVTALESTDLLRAKIFFLPRGDPSLSAALEAHLAGILADNPRFFLLLATNVLRAEPPIGLFGGFVLESRDGRDGLLDIKRAMSPVVDFARIYALKHGVAERGTPDRLDRLAALGVLPEKSRDGPAGCAPHGLRSSTRRSPHAAPPRQPPPPADLTGSDRRLLKEIFTRIRHFQMRLNDFTGMPAQSEQRPPGASSSSDLHGRFEVVNAQIEHARETAARRRRGGRARRRPLRRALRSCVRRGGSFTVPCASLRQPRVPRFDALVAEHAGKFRHLPRAGVATFAGFRCLCLGGAGYMDARNTPRGSEITDRDIARALAHPPGSVDLLLTHDCPEGVGVPNSPGLEYYGDTGFPGSASLDRHFRPKYWLFGHHHKWFELERDGTRYLGLAESWRGYALLAPDFGVRVVRHETAVRDSAWRRFLASLFGV